ncbi:class I SAM-dependent methyltransferase [Streptomyces sp. NPDC057596]|uniref:class I SAM-dependent methyltransferase n=1 Tax=Streptomyces sp. NPDC057596 TaxID=3346178 RepID=UPI0036C8DAF7
MPATRSSSRPGATAEVHDAVAVRCADFARDELDALPPDRAAPAALAAFAGFARTSGPGPVAEPGCGPGRVTAYLRNPGLDVFCVDLSPVMLDLAREACRPPADERSRAPRVTGGGL